MKHLSLNPSNPEKISQEFKEFVSLIVHDFGTPLRGVIEFARLLYKENMDMLTDEGREYLDQIIDSGETLQALLASLLSYSTLSLVVNKKVELDCNAIISTCQLILKDKVAAVRGKLINTNLPVLKGHPQQIQQLFLLILENSLQFHRQNTDPVILISADKTEKWWTFTIEDNGIGIEPQFYSRVFQPFQRLHLDHAGIGMGLTFAKKIVELHGGHIWFETMPHPGSCLRFTLLNFGDDE